MQNKNLLPISHLIDPCEPLGKKTTVGSTTVFIVRSGSLDLKFLRKPLSKEEVEAIRRHNEEHEEGVEKSSQAGIRRSLRGL